MKKWLVAAVLLTVFATPAFANVLVNGDFSTGDLTGWNTWYQRGSNKVWTVENGEAKVGGSGYNGGIWQGFATVAGVTYTVSGEGAFWTSNGSDQSTWSEVIIGTSAPSNGSDYGSGQQLCAKEETMPYFDKVFSAWDTITPNLTFVGTGGMMYITLKHGNTTGSTVTGVYWDNIAVSAPVVPEPGSLLALGTALVGLAGFVRRRR